MKKQLFSLAIIVNAFALIAQPTTNSVMPAIGTNYSFNSVTGSITHPSGGANQTWNFNPLSNSVFLTYSVIPQSVLTSSDLSTYPTTNYFTQSFSGGIPLGVDFLELQSTKLIELGQRNSGSGSNYSSKPPGYARYELGMTLNSVYSFTYGGTPTTRTIKCDGTGTITTPFGTYNSALRLKVTESGSSDTLFAYYSTQPEMRQLLMYVYKQNGTVANKYVYDHAFVPGTTGLNKYKDQLAGVELYPNPTSGVLNIKLKKGSSESKVILYNSLMQKCKEEELANGKIVFEEMEPGVYFLEIKNNDGRILKKIIKN